MDKKIKKENKEVENKTQRKAYTVEDLIKKFNTQDKHKRRGAK